MSWVWILVVLCAVVGAIEMAGVLLASQVSAPQQAGAAAVAIGWAIIPYVFACALERGGAAERAELKRLNETLATHTKLLAEIANSAGRVPTPESGSTGSYDDAR